MRLSCLVCRDILVPSDAVSVAPCGHFLHFTCWIQWLERSDNCPQCRSKTKPKQLVKLFFNVAEGEGGEDNAGVLSNKIDSLTFELRCKNKDIENAKELIEKTRNQNVGLKEEIGKYREEADQAKTACANLKEKIRYLQQQNKDMQDAKKECEKLRSHNQRLTNLDRIIRGSSSEVKHLLDTTSCTPETLRNMALYCGSLKTCLEGTKEKLNREREMNDTQKSKLSKLEDENRLVRAELETALSKNQALSDDIKGLEKENSSLRKKNSKLEAAVLSPSADSLANKALKRLIAESPAPALKHVLDRLNDNGSGLDDSTTDTAAGLKVPSSVLANHEVNLDAISEVEPEEKPDGRSKLQLAIKPSVNLHELDVSPIFGIKPKIVKENISSRSQTSSTIIFGKRRISPSKNTVASGSSYDGLGGHSKADEFPTPIRNVPKKLKRSVSIGKKKLSALTGVPKLSQFDGFIDLDQL